MYLPQKLIGTEEYALQQASELSGDAATTSV